MWLNYYNQWSGRQSSCCKCRGECISSTTNLDVASDQKTLK